VTSEPIEIAVATDERYVPHAATLLRSLTSTHAPEQIRAHILHPPSLRRQTINRLAAMVAGCGGSIEFHAIRPSAVRGMPTMGRIPRVMWYRLLLPELLCDRGRVVYLDCDTLVTDDLTALWELDMRGCCVAAVTNLLPPDLRHRPAQLGLTEASYFNSGVLLVDLEGWRASGCAEQIARLARERPNSLIFPDQDALNIVLAGSRLMLHPRWNCQNSIMYYTWAADVLGAEAVAQARANPAIVHFEGPAFAKPWDAGSTHPYRSAYLEHRAGTPWPSVRSESDSLRVRLRRSLMGSPR
jgi:lipopolysaccharide biosynthesis glycosyltransferase